MPKGYFYEKIFEKPSDKATIYQIQYTTRLQRIYIKLKAYNYYYDDFFSKDCYYPNKNIPDIFNVSYHIKEFADNRTPYMETFIQKLDQFLVDEGHETAEAMTTCKNVKKYTE